MEKKKKKEDSLIKLDHGQLMIDLTDWANPVVILIQQLHHFYLSGWHYNVLNIGVGDFQFEKCFLISVSLWSEG